MVGRGRVRQVGKDVCGGACYAGRQPPLENQGDHRRCGHRRGEFAGQRADRGRNQPGYAEIFTLSYVTGRSVGIGAYVNRLSSRVIQQRHGPMILTGFSALNKLLGRQVYTSQDQLGGPQVMCPNEVTHLLVENDQEGCERILEWLSFVPKYQHGPLPFCPSRCTT